MGPLKHMSAEARARIHEIIDRKMEELEETGLNRFQILDSQTKEKGIELKSDPFFQYLKVNRMAREVLLSPNEEFTVEKVINMALKQEVGIDKSVSMPGKKIIRNNEVSQSYKDHVERACTLVRRTSSTHSTTGRTSSLT